MKKNVTVQIEAAILKRSRHMAVEEDMSLSEWIASLIRSAVNKKSDREQAMKRAFAVMKKPLKLGGKALSREEMHES